MNKKWIVVSVIIGLFLLSFLPWPSIKLGPQVGIITIDEPIMSADEIVEDLDDFYTRSDIDAIIIRLNTPGGAVAPSQEIYEKVKQISESNKKPIIASMGSVAASGGYYIAMGTDSIMANGGTATGSIGVIMSYPVGKKLLDKVGLNFQSIKSGELKDAGSFSREPSNADVNYFQELINDLHLQFVKSAAKERSMPLHQMKKLADGKVYSGLQAKQLGLIDLIGTYEDARNLIKSLLNTEKELNFIHPKHDKDGIFEYIFNDKNIALPFSNLNIFPIPEYRLYYGGRF